MRAYVSLSHTCHIHRILSLPSVLRLTEGKLNLFKRTSLLFWKVISTLASHMLWPGSSSAVEITQLVAALCLTEE
jgi:hypothetical protein